MSGLTAVLIVAGGVCAVFGLWLASNVGGSAQRRAAHHRTIGNPPPRALRDDERHSYRPQTTRGVRVSGLLFVFVGLFVVLIAVVLRSV